MVTIELMLQKLVQSCTIELQKPVVLKDAHIQQNRE